MNFLDAAYQVLKEAGEPLHYTAIAQQALDAGLITPKGATPHATMGSRLYVDTKKEDSLFQRTGKGFFALVPKTRAQQITSQIDQLNNHVINDLRKRLHTMPANRFETLVGELLNALGFDEDSVLVEPYSNDGGIDVRGILQVSGITRLNVAVQVKRWKHNVGKPIVQQIKGALKTHEHGIIITTSGFSAGAIKEATLPGTTPISLVDGEQLIRLLIEHKIGINETPLKVFSIDEEWWGEMLGTQEPVVEAEAPASAAPPPGYPIPLRAGKDLSIEAVLLNPEGQVKWNGQVYDSPSGAAKAAKGVTAVNGWKFWRYQNPETGKWGWIDLLRG
ncbi:MAG: restriction endonuclease [Chloroflexi bacterium]|nr:restriction endonuclease [Chloroflexota bacterium]